MPQSPSPSRHLREISFSDFQKLDIRIGTVIEASVPEWSHWVMKLTVDFGPAFAKATAGKRQRTVFAGIMKFYQPQDLIGKQFAFVVNLEPKKIGPKEPDGTQGFSQAMLLAACQPDEKPVLLSPLEKLPTGAKIR